MKLYLRNIFFLIFISLTLFAEAENSQSADTIVAVDILENYIIEEPAIAKMETDTTLIRPHLDSLTMKKEDSWIKSLIRGNFEMNDTTIHYPKFVKFCMKVYKWADKVFNSYNPDYVVGTGRRWKARLEFDAWWDSYNMHLKKMPVTLISSPYMTAAVNLQYMAVGMSYGIDLNNLMFNKPVNHRKFQFGFNCARFNLDIGYNKTDGGAYVKTLGKFNNPKLTDEFMSGVKMTQLNFDLYYFFNNMKYANAAAYNFSRIQKKSAGSFILGLSYAYENIGLDFNTLPEKLQEYMTFETKNLRFHYHNYCVLFGYGYNVVLPKNFLYNISVMPAIGVIHCFEDSHDGNTKLFSMNLNGRMSLTYNYYDFFTCLIVKMNGHWYKTSKLSVFSAIENVSLSIGVRF